MVLIGTSNYYPTLQSAYDAAAPGSELKVWGTDFAENLSVAINKSVSMKGGFDSGYITNSSQTILHGILTIGAGQLTVENMVVR